MPEEIGVPESPNITPSKFNLQKVLVTVGIIFTIWLLFGGGVWYLVKSSEDNAVKAEETALTASSTAAKTATSSAKTASNDETVDWKTYSDSNFKLSFKHPSDLKPSTKSGDQILNLESESFNFKILSGKFLENTGVTPGNYGEVTIDGVAITKSVVDDQYNKEISAQFVTQGYVFTLVSTFNSENKDEVIEKFNLIISTFKFL